jgi:tetratricopeptide (TPR) repeat protein
MDKSQVLQQARDLASNAKQEEALELLLRFFAQDKQYRHLERKTRHVLAQYKRAERDAMLGVADASSTQLSYNRITQNVLQLADYLEAGELQPGRLSGEQKATPWGAILAGLLGLLVLGGAAWWFLQDGQEPPAATAVDQATACPEFPVNETFRILLFPFRELNDNSLRPHIAIGDRLGAMKEQYGIRCGIRYYDIDTDDLNQYPSTSTDATNLGSKCQAQLVIWGSTEQAAGSAIVQTRYHFLDEAKLPLHKLTVKGESQIDTVKTLSSIASQGIITASIENSIKLLFGLIAHGSGNEPVAQQLLEESQDVQDSSAALTRDLVLADIYLNQRNQQMATARYDSVLSRHPDYSLALNNRALLYYQKGQFAEAAADLSQVMGKEEQADPELLNIRADAYLKSEQLQQAKKDLKQLKTIRDLPEVSRRLDEVDRQIKKEEQTKVKANARLRINPNDLNALQSKASASRRLGDYRTSIKAAEKMLQRDPKNPEAYAELIKAYREQSNTKQAKAVYERAKRAGVDMSKLSQQVPNKVIYLQKQ